MKLIYSELKRLLPGLNYPAEKIADDLTLIGHLSEGVDKENGEEVINLEIAKDRGDALSYMGLAKDLSIFYNLNLNTQKVKLPTVNNKPAPGISITAKKAVDRLMSLKIIGIKNKTSPNWLKKVLRLHEINPINALVDLTNYVMLIYGVPCHAFDAQKVSNQLEWKIAEAKGKITTLDGTKIDIPIGSLVINDPKGAASLSTIGGQRTAIDLNTTETIIEMAIYNPTRVRLDSKNMGIITEASIRLEKELDTELIPTAFNHLIQLILKHCNGKIVTQTYDYYPERPKLPSIEFHPEKPAEFAGIDIPKKFSLSILTSLDCKVDQSGTSCQVIPPSVRKDLCLEEDLIEEVIRFYGYNKIPVDQPISSEKISDITPKILYLLQTIKNILVNLGYDEIRSWPIIRENNLHKPSYLPKNAQPIYTENNVNSEYPLLRMSLTSSLYLQTIQSKKFKLPDRQFFEIGKIYYQLNGKYLEKYSVSLYRPNNKSLKNDVEKLFNKLNREGDYSVEKINAKTFIEINLDKLVGVLSEIPEFSLDSPQVQTSGAVELTSQIINLDANVILDKKTAPEKLINIYQQKIPNDSLWKLEITDIYQTDDKKFKYTFRAYYYNITASKAKQIHLKAFKLTTAKGET